MEWRPGTVLFWHCHFGTVPHWLRAALSCAKKTGWAREGRLPAAFSGSAVRGLPLLVFTEGMVYNNARIGGRLPQFVK